MKKKVLTVLLGIVLLLLFLNYLFPSRTTYYGLINITDKDITNDTYYLYSHLEKEPIEIAIDQTDTFTYEESPGEIEEVSIDAIWHLIEPNSTYFVRITTHIFRSTYEMEKLYGH